jgi:hypothetical protein
MHFIRLVGKFVLHHCGSPASGASSLLAIMAALCRVAAVLA